MARIGCDVVVCFQLKDWRPDGDLNNFKVRLANAIAINTCVLIGLILCCRPKTFAVIEQPKGSFMWKMDCFKKLFTQFSAFACILTYMGMFGLDLLKPTHPRPTYQQQRAFARKATKAAKRKFVERMERKREKMLRMGKVPPTYPRLSTLSDLSQPYSRLGQQHMLRPISKMGLYRLNEMMVQIVAP